MKEAAPSKNTCYSTPSGLFNQVSLSFRSPAQLDALRTFQSKCPSPFCYQAQLDAFAAAANVSTPYVSPFKKVIVTTEGYCGSSCSTFFLTAWLHAKSTPGAVPFQVWAHHTSRLVWISSGLATVGFVVSRVWRPWMCTTCICCIVQRPALGQTGH